MFWIAAVLYIRQCAQEPRYQHRRASSKRYGKPQSRKNSEPQSREERKEQPKQEHQGNYRRANRKAAKSAKNSQSKNSKATTAECAECAENSQSNYCRDHRERLRRTENSATGVRRSGRIRDAPASLPGRQALRNGDGSGTISRSCPAHHHASPGGMPPCRVSCQTLCPLTQTI